MPEDDLLIGYVNFHLFAQAQMEAGADGCRVLRQGFYESLNFIVI
jgi:hypothetical protein